MRLRQGHERRHSCVKLHMLTQRLVSIGLDESNQDPKTMTHLQQGELPLRWQVHVGKVLCA